MLQRVRLTTLKKNVSLVLMLLFSSVFVQAGEHKSYELPNVKVIPIEDTQSNKRYELYIKLPEKYHENKDKNYPVIYFTDAVWHIELLSSATYFLMDGVILVGISWQKDIEKALIEEHGESISRARDYSISQSDKPERQKKYKFGQADKHLAFIRNDVINYVENNYRTTPENRSYFGFSAGGLFGAYILSSQPDTFKNYILGSPSLWRDTSKLAAYTEKHKALNANVLISRGSKEQDLGEHINEFVSLLEKKNDQSLLLNHIEIESAGHSDSFPMLGVRSVTWLSSLMNKEGE